MTLKIDDASNQHFGSNIPPVTAKNRASVVFEEQISVGRAHRRPKNKVAKSLLLLLFVIAAYCGLSSQAFAAGCSPSLTFTTANPTQTFELQGGRLTVMPLVLVTI